MPDRSLSEAPAPEPLRTAASAVALVAVAVAVIGAVLAGFDLTTRPPCKPGYVQFVDLEPVAVFISVGFAVVALVVYWRSRRGRHLATITAVGIAVLLCAALVAVGAGANVVHHHGERYDSGCWTF